MSHPPTATCRVLVVRNDKLGDFMLAWPALAALKQAGAALHITALVPHYTAEIAEACPWVDNVMVDPGDKASRDDQATLLARIKAAQFTAMLTLFSTPRIGWLGWRAGISTRVAPATKWAQVFYNIRVRQRRSRSARPEYRYNVELAQALLTKLDKTHPAPVKPPFWPLDTSIRTRARDRFIHALLDANNDVQSAAERRLIVIHPGSGGSAVNLTLEQYATLARQVEQQTNIPLGWLISAGPGEQSQADELSHTLQAAGLVAASLAPRGSVVAFGHDLSGADLLIAGSTGPLHIAGCLDIATAGFYPAKRSATALRWQTCNAAEKRLAFSPPPDALQDDMSAVDISTAAGTIASFLSTDTRVSPCNE